MTNEHDIDDPMSLSSILFVDMEEQSHAITSRTLSSEEYFIENLSNIDGSRDTLAFNGMID